MDEVQSQLNKKTCANTFFCLAHKEPIYIYIYIILLDINDIFSQIKFYPYYFLKCH